MDVSYQYSENEPEVRVIINVQTNLRLRPSHRTLLGVLTSESGQRSITSQAETSFRLLAEAMVGMRLAQAGRDPRTEVLLFALIAAAHEAHPLQSPPWYRVSLNGTRLERWSIVQQDYCDVETPYQLPQVPAARR